MNQRGIVYVVSLGIAFLLTIAGASMLMRGLSETSLSERSRNQTSAFHLADAGIDQAAANLRTADLADDVLTATLPAGAFSILTVDQIGPQMQRVTSRGTAASERHDVEAVIQLTPQSVFQFALFGDQQVNVSGNAITDSYDSASGLYDPANHQHNGDVGTNATGSGGVTVGGSIFVDGQVAVGPNISNPVSVVTGYDPAFITGGTSPPTDTQDVVSQSSTFPMPAVTVPGWLTCSDFTVGGNETVTLAPGTYCYQNLTIEGGGTLTTSASVTIYMTGMLTARGNSLMGVPSSPKDMVVLMAPTGDATLEQGTLTGSTGFYGALYAPDSTINVTGNADVYGSIIAERVNVTGSASIHYDESLTSVTQVSNLYRSAIVSWRDL